MRIETDADTGIVAFIFEGRLDAVTSDQVEGELMAAIADNGRYLYDLTSLEYVSSAGLRVLLATSKQIQRQQGAFVMCGANPNVRHILDISGFATLFQLVDSRAEGLQFLRG
jgi:anti-anti-sigma factor